MSGFHEFLFNTARGRAILRHILIPYFISFQRHYIQAGPWAEMLRDAG
jgi:hypothetical protein